jgi:hypothetical protein
MKNKFFPREISHIVLLNRIYRFSIPEKRRRLLALFLVALLTLTVFRGLSNINISAMTVEQTVWTENFEGKTDIFNDTAFWVRHGNSLITTESNKVITGTKSMYYDNTDGGWNTFVSTTSPSELPILKNTSYKLQATIKEFSVAQTDRYYMQIETTAGGNWPTYIHWLGANATTVTPKSVVLTQNGSYEITKIADNTYTVTLMFTSSDAELMVGFGINGLGAMSVDDVTLTRITDDPGPVMPGKTGVSSGTIDVTSGESVVTEGFETIDIAAPDRGLEFFRKTAFWNSAPSLAFATTDVIAGGKMIDYLLSSDNDTVLFGSSASELAMEKGKKYIATFKYRTNTDVDKMIFEYENDSSFGYWVHFNPVTFEVIDSSIGATYMIRNDNRGYCYASFIFEATLDNSYLIFKGAGQNGQISFDEITLNQASETTIQYKEGFDNLTLSSRTKPDNLYQNTYFWHAGQKLNFIDSANSINGISLEYTAFTPAIDALLGSTHTELKFAAGSQSVISFKYKLTESANLKFLYFQINQQDNGFTYWVHWDPKTLAAVDTSPDAIYSITKEGDIVTASFLVKNFEEGDYMLIQTDGTATIVMDDFLVLKEDENAVKWQVLAPDLIGASGLLTMALTSNGGEGELIDNNTAVRGSLPYEGDWTEYMQTNNRRVVLTPGNRYKIRFAFNIESPPSGSGFLTFLIKNSSGLPADDIFIGIDKNYKFVTSFTNKIDSATITESGGKRYAEISFTNHNSSGSYIAFGIHNVTGLETGTASVLISDFSISGVAGLGENIIREDNEIVIFREEPDYTILDQTTAHDDAGTGFENVSPVINKSIVFGQIISADSTDGSDESSIDESSETSISEESSLNESSEIDSSSNEPGVSSNSGSKNNSVTSGSTGNGDEETTPPNVPLIIAIVVMVFTLVGGSTYFIIRRRNNVKK